MSGWLVVMHTYLYIPRSVVIVTIPIIVGQMVDTLRRWACVFYGLMDPSILMDIGRSFYAIPQDKCMSERRQLSVKNFASGRETNTVRTSPKKWLDR